jgi:hypothetical protein
VIEQQWKSSNSTLEGRRSQIEDGLMCVNSGGDNYGMVVVVIVVVVEEAPIVNFSS